MRREAHGSTIFCAYHHPVIANPLVQLPPLGQDATTQESNKEEADIE